MGKKFPNGSRFKDIDKTQIFFSLYNYFLVQYAFQYISYTKYFSVVFPLARSEVTRSSHLTIYLSKHVSLCPSRRDDRWKINQYHNTVRDDDVQKIWRQIELLKSRPRQNEQRERLKHATNDQKHDHTRAQTKVFGVIQPRRHLRLAITRIFYWPSLSYTRGEMNCVAK